MIQKYHTYRPEIDGLRAIAVLAVIFYHADFVSLPFNPFRGGFIGVDVFFVISGYLIGGILLRHLALGDFSFRNFYERRARRILPMLFVVMFASIPFAWTYMFPAAFIDYAKSILTSTFFSSNILFWREGGYAAGANALKPFLHTWSLSIEEQFYLFFPVVLLVCWRYARNLITPLMVGGFAVSLGLAQWASQNYSAGDFYLLPTRAFELLAGALIAKHELEKGRSSHKLFPALGLGLILASIVLFTNDTPHPSLLTVIPVIGVMLVISYGGQNDVASRFLSLRPVVFIGLVSYSLYLWHQPIFAFARLHAINALNDDYKIGLIALTAVLSVLSWCFIEKPFRDKAKVSTRTLYMVLALAAVLLTGFSVAGIAAKGFPQRFHFPMMADLDQKIDLIYDHGEKCHERAVKDACTLGSQDAKQHWYVVGDSHMGYLSTYLWDALKNKNAQMTILTRGGCPYAPGLVVGNGAKDHPCPPEMNAERRELLLKAPPGIVVLGGRLPYYLSGQGFDNGEGGVETLEGNFSYKLNGIHVRDTLAADIKELAAHGHTVVLIYPTPEIGWNVPDTIKKTMLSKSSQDFDAWMKQGGLTVSYDVFKARSREADALYDAAGTSSRIIRIHPGTFFCNTAVKNRCISHTDKEVYYSDQDHLSAVGNSLVVKDILKRVETRD